MCLLGDFNEFIIKEHLALLLFFVGKKAARPREGSFYTMPIAICYLKDSQLHFTVHREQKKAGKKVFKIDFFLS